MHIPSAQIPWLDLCRRSTPNIKGGWEQLLSLGACGGSAAQEAQEAHGERFSCVAPGEYRRDSCHCSFYSSFFEKEYFPGI